MMFLSFYYKQERVNTKLIIVPLTHLLQSKMCVCVCVCVHFDKYKGVLIKGGEMIWACGIQGREKKFIWET